MDPIANIRTLRLSYLLLCCFVQRSRSEHKARPTGLIYTYSNLATVPLARVPGYSASKAAQHAFTVATREQLRPMNVKIQEIISPVVHEIHDAKHKPDYNEPASPGLPLEEFTDEAFMGW